MNAYPLVHLELSMKSSPARAGSQNTIAPIPHALIVARQIPFRVALQFMQRSKDSTLFATTQSPFLALISLLGGCTLTRHAPTILCSKSPTIAKQVEDYARKALLPSLLNSYVMIVPMP